MKFPNVPSQATPFNLGLFVILALLLAGCGSGGGSGGTVTSSQTFPLQSAMKDSVTKGSSTNFTITGTCNGTASIVTLIPTAASFEGASGVSATSTTTLSFSNCLPSYDQSFATDYYDTNFVPLGSIVTGGDYGVFLTPPVIPASVKVGDKGTIGTIKNYSDSTKAVATGQDVYSYAIEPDTANTAIVNKIIKAYDAAGILSATEQDRYRISTTGTLTQISSDLQLSNGSTNHFIFTVIPDTVAPTVISTTPTNTSIDVSASTSITATFSEPLDASTVTAATFSLTAGSGVEVAGTVSYSGTTAIFATSAPLATSTLFTATFTTGIKDLAGNAMSSNYSWTFTTLAPDLTPPTVVSTNPVNLAIGVALNNTITASFSEALNPATITGAEFTLMNGSTPVSGSVTYSGITATFIPSVSLIPNTRYTATITTGINDIAGNAMSANYSWSFQTYVPPAPTVLSTSPVPYAYAAVLNNAVTTTFSTPMDPATVTAASFTLLGGTTPVSGSVSYSGNTATFTPLVPLASNTVYTATITTGVKDLVGTAMSTNYSWTFQTFADGSSTGPVNPPPAGLWQPAPGSTPATGNYVYLLSDVGDYIGQGQTYTYTPATAILTITANGGHLSANVIGNTWWYGNFQTMNQLTQLQPGFYPGLQRYLFHNPVLGGLDWSGDGRGCNTEKGWFAIDAVTYDVNGVLTAIDLRFEQNCEGVTTALHGAIHWGP